MRSFLVVLLLTAVGPGLAGCVTCTPETVPAEVTVALDDELVRTLPVQPSGATRLAGIDVPDAHGRLNLKAGVSHGLDQVTVDSLRLEVSAAGIDLPIKLIHVSGSDWSENSDGTWDGTLRDGGLATLWWTINRAEIAAASQLALSEGDGYEARVTFTWEHDSCSYQAFGSVDTTFTGIVATSADAVALEPLAEPEVEETETGVGFQAPFQVGSGIELRIDDATALGVHLTTGASNRITVVTFPMVAWTVDGEEAAAVAPGQELVVQSEGVGAAGAYAASGVWAPAVPLEEGLLLLLLDVDYTATDPTVGSGRDEFVFALEM